MRPILFSLGGIDLMSAPVFAGLASLLAFLYVKNHRRHAQLSIDELWMLMLFLALATMAGGVSLHTLLYGRGPMGNIEYMLHKHRIHGGSFFGNLWGSVLGAALFARLYRKRLPALADLIGGAAPLALALHRVGCLLHGCCYGTPTDLPWTVVFTDPRCGVRSSMRGIGLHPTQTYESVGCLAIFLFVHFVVFRSVRRGEVRPGTSFAASVILYSVLRFLLEFVRGADPGVLSAFGMNTSQILAAASVAAVLLLHRRWSRAGR